MIKIFYLISFAILCGAQSFGQAFITTWKTDNPGISANNQITIPIGEGFYNYSIYWEEVDNPTVNGTIPGPITDEYTITFPSAGIYRVHITGVFSRIYFNGVTDPFINSDFDKILTIEQWGSIEWASMAHAFQGCTNLSITATDAPNLTRVTDMSYMFAETENFNQPIEHWDVSHVTNMEGMFYNCLFNQPLAKWDVSNVISMGGMFRVATNFNQPLNMWNVSNVKIMASMFGAAISFNQPLDNWNVSKVTRMDNMFTFAFNFNQSLGVWNVGNVTDMDGMLDFSGLSISNYDATLIGWASKNVKPNVVLRAISLKYCTGTAARAQLISKGWIITGDINRMPANPSLDITQAICDGSTGTITVNVQEPTETYSFNGGADFQSSHVKTLLGPGVYSVIIKNEDGCNSLPEQVSINQPFQKPATPIISGSTVVCPNILEVDYTASNPEYTYQWFINGGTLQNQQGNAIKVNWAGSNFNASVKAIGIDEHNCPTDTAIFPVKVQIKLKPITPVGFDSVCYNFRTGVPYQTSFTIGSVYTWFTNGGVVSEGQSTKNVKIDWANIGNYKLWIKEENTTNTDYCEGISDTLTVNVFKDLAAITMDFVSVDYNNDKNVKLQWDVSLLERVSDLVIISRRLAGSNNPWEIVAELEKNIQSFLDENLSTSANVYEYKVEGFNKCDEGLQTVIHNTIKLEGDKVEDEEIINLDWNDYNGWDEVERYEVWRKLDGEQTYKLIDITPGDLTSYSGKYGADGFVHQLRIKAKKKDANTISWSNEIELNFENPIDFIPNVITPDGDLKNDFFIVPKLHLYPENILTVHDRWGKIVYTKIKYENTWNAQDLSDGVYYYTLKVLNTNRIYKGWVQVLK